MKQKELRFRISEDLWKRYKHVCVERMLSVPKQSTALIKKFVEIQEENLEKEKGK